MSKGSKFVGSFVAIVTPFRRKGILYVIDWRSLARLIEYHVKNGTRGIVVGGCTGESFTLTIEEQKKLIAFVVKKVRGRLLVIAGTGSNSTAEAISLTKFAQQVGADCAMLITPYANKPTAAGLIAHFTAIAKAVPGMPIMLYNVPGRTGLKMSPETIAYLYIHVKNIVAIKEASGDVNHVSQILQLCDITVLAGDDALTLPMMSVGAMGVVSVTANVWARKVADMVTAFLSGNIEKARKLHHELFPVSNIMFIETNPGPVKAALKMMDMIEHDDLRPPLAAMEQSNRQKVADTLKSVGLLAA